MSDVSWKLIDSHCDQVKDAVNSAKAPLVLALTWSIFWLCALYANAFSLAEGLERRTIYTTVLLDFVQTETSKPALASGKDLPPIPPPTKTAAAKPGEPAAPSAPAEKVTDAVSQRPNVLKICIDHLFHEDQSKLAELDWIKSRTKAIAGKTELDQADQKLAEYILKTCRTIMAKRLEHAEIRRLDARYITLPGGFDTIPISDFGIVGGVGLLLMMTWLAMTLRRVRHAVGAFFNVDALNLDSPGGVILAPAFRCYSGSHLTYAYQAVSQRFFLVSATLDARVWFASAILLAFPLVPIGFNAYLSLEALDNPIWESRVYYVAIGEFSLMVAIIALVITNFMQVRRTGRILHAWYVAATSEWGHDIGTDGNNPAKRLEIGTGAQVARHQVRAEDRAPRDDGGGRP